MHPMMGSEGLPLLVAKLAAGVAAAAPRSFREAAAASAKELASVTSAQTQSKGGAWQTSRARCQHSWPP